MKKLSLTISIITLSIFSISPTFAKPGNGERPEPPVFSELDADGDSYITLEEFKLKEIPRGDHDNLFDHIDGDGDGFISENEFSSHKPPRGRRNEEK